MSATETVFITSLTVIDPDSGRAVEVEVHKDPASGGIFALDASFVEQVADTITSPFAAGQQLRLSESVSTPAGDPRDRMGAHDVIGELYRVADDYQATTLDELQRKAKLTWDCHGDGDFSHWTNPVGQVCEQCGRGQDEGELPARERAQA